MSNGAPFPLHRLTLLYPLGECFRRTGVVFRLVDLISERSDGIIMPTTFSTVSATVIKPIIIDSHIC